MDTETFVKLPCNHTFLKSPILELPDPKSVFLIHESLYFITFSFTISLPVWVLLCALETFCSVGSLFRKPKKLPTSMDYKLIFNTQLT